MHSFILSRQVGEIPLALPLGVKIDILHGLTVLGDICFRTHVEWNEVWTTIPEVCMWEGHEIAFFSLYDAYVTDMQKASRFGAVHALPRYVHHRDTWQSMIWPSSMDEPHMQYDMVDPILEASDNLIHSHQVALVAQYPLLAGLFPAVVDLSTDPILAWA